MTTEEANTQKAYQEALRYLSQPMPEDDCPESLRDAVLGVRAASLRLVIAEEAVRMAALERPGQ